LPNPTRLNLQDGSGYSQRSTKRGRPKNGDVEGVACGTEPSVQSKVRRVRRRPQTGKGLERAAHGQDRHM
jgi:hypothetical protein